VADDESTLLTVTLPATIGESDGTLPGAGSVSLSGTLDADLAVSLASLDTAHLQVPASTTVVAGSTEATFDLMPVDDVVENAPRDVTVTASAAGFDDGSADTSILDDEADSLRVTVVDPTPVRAGAALTVRVEALDALGNPVPAYGKSVAVTAAASGGTLPTTPTTVALSGGVFEAPIRVDGVGDGVVLGFVDPEGAAGESAPFDVVSGPLSGFDVAPVASPQTIDAPFDLTVTAVDDAGYPARRAS
jgi:hypothetical protein